MSESFELLVVGNQVIQTTLVIRGYKHWFEATVGVTKVVYERDEEGQYRAVCSEPFANVDKELVTAVGQKIQATFG